MKASSQLNLLVIEDNPAIASNIADYFDMQGNNLDFAYTGEQGCELALTQYFDCIILDIMLPDIEGLEVCQRLRLQADRHIPIIMLTARDTLDDKLAGFAQGADDYLTKPFSLEELAARVSALTCRLNPTSAARTLSVGDADKQVTLNYQSQTVTRGETALVLPPILFNILKILMESYPRAVSKSELVERIWGEEGTDSDSLRSHIYQLRKAVDKPFPTAIIKTIHSVGLVLDL
ncbi:response regulator transcription factor [Pseudoalteromonas sp. JC3]|uniref:response regulator transcription factor n=1 Tax=Pseudoalteromonas sp. JC3 TaxID=2810196 RepID=UPI0019D2DF7D|nr:response regulator transcription factor [Pseudoalteromonas sp. JC3]MBR8844583.1 response regulator transcription factor [Pseudoalteromonas sp. JC3]WJE10413.1 response regulator transcription factor [Pseudoalteromonas sp. JC3]